MQRTAQQINGREGETAALLSQRVLPLVSCAAVSPHVISIVMLLMMSLRETYENA